MTDTTTGLTLRRLLALAAPIALAACGGSEAEEVTYEADATDLSGGELIVTEQTPAVDVDLPDVTMTAVPESEADAATETATPAAPSE